MLSKTKEKLIKQLHSKKGREKHNLCLVEGEKNIKTAHKYIDFTFTPQDTNNFDKLVTTKSPQPIAAIARIPRWEKKDIKKSKTVVVLDGVQIPGNVGTILRLCLGFEASLVLIESVDVSNSKVIRSSAGAMFQVPWINVSRKNAINFLKKIQKDIYRLELKKNSKLIKQNNTLDSSQAVIIAGSEGEGIKLNIKGESVAIKHNSKLESLNVTHALAIALNHRYNLKNVKENNLKAD